jgi:ADP-heptose:LPS heptosyltransferase
MFLTNSTIYLARRLSWEQFVATVANASAVVTVDSVSGHVAACFGVPAVVLTSGRTRLNLWRPNSPSAIALTHPVGCATCHRTRGCAAMACVKLIGVEDVLASLEKVIKARRSVYQDSPSRLRSVPSHQRDWEYDGRHPASLHGNAEQ